MSQSSDSSSVAFQKYKVSPSTKYLLEQYKPGQEVSSLELVDFLFKNHPNYGKAKAKEIFKEKNLPSTKSQYIESWVEDIERLYVPDRLKIIHGRHVILGLAVIDPVLGRFLSDNGLFDLINEELKEGIYPEGKAAFENLIQERFSSDQTLLYADSPARKDRLGRKQFAVALARFLTRLWKQSQEKFGNSFIMNLHGPWGSGKTSLLHLLSHELKHMHQIEFAGDSETKLKFPWTVIQFNAWKNQHIDPPWWPLMDAVYRQAVDKSNEDDPQRIQIIINKGQVLYA